MKDKELDEILKEKLQNRINPSPEFELKVIRQVEKQKQQIIEQRENENNSFKKVALTTKKQTKSKNSFKVISNWTKALSIAAVFVVVFTLGMNLKTAPFVGDESNANLISIKAIEPTNLESGVLANNSEFIIHAEGKNLNTEAIRKSIYVEPALDYTIEKTLNKNQFKLTFKQNIPDNTLVKLQYVKNQITEGSWAYQTSDKLSVTRTYPANERDEVSKNTIIDIEFSYANVENLEQNIKITPEVKGSWKHLGNIWRFTPSTALKDSQKYVVTISKNVKADDQTLENDYKFSFIVNPQDVGVEYTSISMDKIITARPDEKLKISYNNYSDGKTKISNKVEISRFANIDDFIEYLEKDNYEKASKLEDYEVIEKDNQSEQNTQYYLELKKSLPTGYYVAKVKNTSGKELFTCPIQISEISAYSIETERDVLVWVAKGNDLAQNINVEYQGKSAKTDSNGIAKLEGVADNSKEIKYIKVDNQLVIGAYNYSLDNYPSAYIYTDRPLYKNTDTINIWGFVPRKLFYDKIDEEFYIELDEEGKKKVEVGKDGSFQAKIELKNHVDSEYSCVSLEYKNTTIATRYIAIENYELQNYTYEIINTKNYGYAGDKLNFDVKVKHITGLVVPNKKVVLTYEDETLIETTGEDGIAHFTIKLTMDDKRNTTYPESQGISVFNGDEEEYNNAETYSTVYVLNRNVHTEDEYENKGVYKAILYRLADDRNVQIDYDLKDLYNGTYETTVDVYLIEEVSTRYISGYEVNEYTKENEPQYDYNTTENKIKIKTVISKDGVVEISKKDFEGKEKQDTEEVSYNYNIELSFKDISGRIVEESIYMYYDYEDEFLGYFYSNDYTEIYNVPANIDIDMYHTYRYLLKSDTSKFKIGDTASFTLAESTNMGIKDIQNSGKLLSIAFKENILKTDLITDNNISYTFEEKDFPGSHITSAYFVNGKFYRMPIQYFDFDEETKKVDVEITSDKEEYKPGDEVKLKIKTTKDGKGVKSFVNVSVVNEAVFAIEDDTTNILERIYANKIYPAYTYSSYKDVLKRASGGEGGGDGETRANFADTAHFETVYTNGSGIAEVKFKLPDNVTTYRVTAQSANEDLEIGTNTKQITSKLNFFIQAVAPRGIKTTDDVVLNATSVSDTKYDVDYEFTIKETNKTLTAKGTSNTITTVNFGKLPYGTYHAIIKGKHGAEEDSIEYEFKVVESNQEVYNKTTMNINSNSTIKPTKNPITLEIYNKKSSKYVEYIDFIESTLTERLDTQIAYNKAQDIKDKYYGAENSAIRYIPVEQYSDGQYLRNLKNGKNDIVLTALAEYYAKDYCYGVNILELSEKDNVFEYYLLLAAKNEPVLNDLIYLKEEKDISNYNKLLVTLGLEFVGDYTNAKDLYSQISLNNEEVNKYKSIIATIETFIKKENVSDKIDELIKNSPSDEYLRFAILSYFQNNSAQIGKEENVKITSKNLNETITINEMEVKKYTIYNEDLSDIKFETESQDLMVSYYYQTLLDNVENKNVKKDIKITGNGELKKGNTVNLNIEFDGNYEGEVRIALPNSLRLAQNANETINEDARYYINSNHIDYITIYKTKKCNRIRLPLLVTAEGNYRFENVVCTVDGTYHISNSMNLNIK